MEDKYLLAINSMTQEQYNQYFKHLPIPYSFIKSNPKKFIEILASDNELLSQLMNDFLKNNIQIVNILSKGSNYEFCIYIDTNNQTEKNFAKQIREKLNLDSTQFSLSSAGNGIVQINVSVKELKGVLDFKNLVENYFSVNKNNSNRLYDELNPELLNNILQQYSNIPQEIIERILEENQKEIIHLIEKEKEKNNFVNPNVNNTEYEEILLENDVDLKYIHSMDLTYKKIPFSELTEDMKKTMCNKYCQALINSKLLRLQNELSKQSRSEIQFIFRKQPQNNIGNYGITGNTKPFDKENNKTVLDIYSYSKLQYFKLENGKVSVNEELLGQIMIIMLHEYRHSEQQQAIRDGVQNNPLVEAIKAFELKCKDNPNYYVDNYKDDPAEIDANFYSFAEFKKIAQQYGIQEPDKIILDIVKDVRDNAEETHRIYDTEFNSYDEVMTFLETKLQSQFKSKQEINIPNSESQLEKEKKNMEQPLRSYLSQTNPEIEISPNYINYAEFQRTSDEKSQTEKRKNPLVSDNKVIGELEENEVYDFETATSKTYRLETVESKKGIFTINSEIQRSGEQYSVIATMEVLNEISKSKEKATYTRDMDGNETYTYMENGKKGQIIKKTERGTTIDIYKDGQPYATYEYDENGKALVPMGTMEQLPEDYIEKCFRMPLPEYEEIQYQETEQEIVSTQKLGKETLDMQQDPATLDSVEKQIEEQEFEINQSGEIIRKGRTAGGFDLGGTTSEYATQTLNQFMQNLDNGNLDDENKRKKDDEFKVEKGDDDYIR